MRSVIGICGGIQSTLDNNHVIGGRLNLVPVDHSVVTDHAGDTEAESRCRLAQGSRCRRALDGGAILDTAVSARKKV